jgi:tripartite-type tricarboxylate transporter receptor subunit TctC
MEKSVMSGNPFRIMIARGLFALLALPCAVWAQTAYPGKPIRLVLPFPPGAPSDIIGRALGSKLSEQMATPVVADNRVGAGGNVGLSIVAKALPDGYTIVITTPAIALSPSLYANLGYDPQKDLTPIARLAAIENVVLVHPAVPAKTLRDFVELARKQPGKLTYGSGGPGTTNHLANELLKSLEKIDLLHVPYKGATVAAVALMGAEVDEVIVSVASSLPYIRSGKVRAIAVLSEKRVAPLPDVPTAKEAGVPGFQMSIWYGMLAPGNMPKELVTRLNTEAVKALNSPEVRKSFGAQGVDPWPGTPAEFDSLIRSETARYAKIIERAGLKKE